MTLYTAAGIYKMKEGPGGNRYPVVMQGGQEHEVDVAEMILWMKLNFHFLDLAELEAQYQKTVLEFSLPDMKSSSAYIDRMLQRGLVVAGAGDTKHDALFDLLSNLYLVPTACGFWAKFGSFVKQTFVKGLPIRETRRIFARRHLSACEKEVLALARQNRLSTAEIITSIEKGETRLHTDNRVLEAIYGDADTTFDNLGSTARLLPRETPCLTAVANLYLQQLIVFERI